MEAEIIEYVDFSPCRCCLLSQETSMMEDIFDCFYESFDFIQILEFSTSILISADDDLTKLICSTCKSRAIDAFCFKKTCMNSDEKLRSIKEVEEACEEADDFLQSDDEDELSGYEESSLVCEHCQQIFEFSSELEDHIALFHTESEQIEEIETLIEKSQKSRKYDCNICGKEFATPSKVQRHLNVHRDVLEPSELPPKKPKRPYKHVCLICGKRVETPSKLDRHMRVHDKSDKIYLGIDQHRPYPCPNCDKRFFSKIKMERHQIIHSDEVTRSKIDHPPGHVFTCVICLLKISDFNECIEHMKSHREELGENNPISCKICSRTYPKISNLIRHSRSHPENATHCCCHCEKLFGMGDDFLDHMLRHQGYRPFVCDHPGCGRSFNKIHRLRQHKQNHEANGKLFSCDLCGKEFTESEYLKRHLLRHSGIKEHTCNLCPARFTFKSGLTAHMVTHTKQKNFQCDVCSATFSKKNSLKNHTFTHTGEKRYRCEVCDVAFTTVGLLTRHSRTHTGKKPYQCQYCSKCYSQSNDLTKHLRSHLGKNVYRCDVEGCEEAFAKFNELKNHTSEHFQKGEINASFE